MKMTPNQQNLAQNNFDAAIRLFNGALELRPGNIEIQFYIHRTRHQSRERALAESRTMQFQQWQAQAQAEQARFKLADLRYRNGAASYLDVLDAQRSLFAAQQAVVQVQAAQVQNLVALYKVLGGGWVDGPGGKTQ